MMIMTEDQYNRAQKHKKQEMYRMMLDHQLKYKSQSKQQRQTERSNRYPQNNRALSFSFRDHQPNNHQKQSMLPSINASHAQQFNFQKMPKIKHSVQAVDEDKTEIYLNNCEQIIHNLRQMKNRRMTKQPMQLRNNPEVVPKYRSQQKSKNDVEYYPKPSSFFASSGIPYNKVIPIAYNSSSKTTKHRQKLKSLPSVENGPIKEFSSPQNMKQKRSFSVKNSSRYKKTSNQKNNDDSNVKRFNEIEQDKNEQEQEPVQSQTPLGFKTQVIQSENNNLKKNFIKAIYQKESMDIQKYPPFRLNNISYLERNRPQIIQNKNQELKECLTELTKYLKYQNQKQESSKKKEISESQFKRPKNNSYDNINKMSPPSQLIKRAQHHNSNKSQQEDKQSNQQSPQYNLQSLQYKTIQALRNINSKSHQFYVRIKGDHLQQQKIYSQDSQSIHNLINYIQEQHTNQEQDLLPLTNQVLTQKHQSLSFTNQKLAYKGKNEKQQNVIRAEQLLKLMVKQMQRQGDYHEDLNVCLSELIVYLKNQNEQMNEDRLSRISPIKGQSLPVNKINQSQQLQVHRQEIKTQNILKQQQVVKSEQDRTMQKVNEKKLHEEVLKRLKKARLRGSLLKQKVQNFKNKRFLKQINPNQQSQIKQQLTIPQLNPPQQSNPPTFQNQIRTSN